MKQQGEVTNYDGRDTLFARLDLVPSTSRYEEYYRRHPELKGADDTLRESGGLMRLVAAGGLSLTETQALRPRPDEAAGILERLPDEALARALIDDSSATIEDYTQADLARKSSSRQVNLPVERMTALVKEVARFYGASLVGITDLRDRHYYTHRRSGEPVNREFSNAIVFAVEMNKALVNRAPYRETLLATCNGYVDAARVGARLSGLVKSLGYHTSLNTMVKYDAPLVPLAEQAGLGQRGRCHFIVTKTFGNRVRLGAVLTNLPLVVDQAIDFGLHDFCIMCGKCAANCPGKAISRGNPRSVDGSPVWAFDEIRCMRTWIEFATDCGICIASCPFSQGVSSDRIDVMKGRPDIMQAILQQDRETYGNRAYNPEPLPLTDW